MGNKKIDNLFQEQLKNLEVSPNKRVWNNIEAQLTKKKRKIFPFWWFAGTAASILVLITLFYPFSSDVNQNYQNNSDEIITTIPDDKPIIKNKIDSLQFKNKVKNEILISKKENVFKVAPKIISGTKPISPEKIYQPKKRVSNLLLSYNTVNIDFNLPKETASLTIKKINPHKTNLQKLNIADLVENKTNQKTIESEKNWSIAPSFAVLKSNSLSDSSPINAGLAESTSGENSYSYGVQVAYQLNNKWSVQTGIHLQETSYANNQVSVNSSSQNNPFATAFTNGDTFSFDNNNSSITNESSLLVSNFVSNSVISNTGNINQNYGYIEIPVEIKYNFSNNPKLETQIVTGFSTLFLNKNEVILNTQNFSRALEASNLNALNFSGNVGFDFNYFLTKNWAFNVNPMFKLQLNTFSDNANGFAPFNIGIYTGIKYQF